MNQASNTGNSVSSPEWLQQTQQLGFEALAQGRISEAQESVRRLLTAKPVLVDGHYLAYKFIFIFYKNMLLLGWERAKKNGPG
jgi:hypothetical protein